MWWNYNNSHFFSLQSETLSETTEKKSVSKKKKVDGTESTKKKTRKSKKSDEKENISVVSELLYSSHGSFIFFDAIGSDFQFIAF